MNRILLLIMMICPLGLYAQKNAPKWMDKSKKAVISITTYDKNNRELGKETGFFISETGEALSGYSAFNGAGRATVTDSDGQTWPVASIIGADELYDVIKFKVTVPKKVAYLPIASEPVAENTQVYQLAYSPGKEINYTEGEILEVSNVKSPYSYYKISFALDPNRGNAPLVLPTGEVLALSQPDASGKNEISYGMSAGYIHTLEQKSVDIFNPVYSKIGIRKAWPTDVEQASVSLFLLANQQDAQSYLETLNDFIATFPNEPDGYTNRGSHYAYYRAILGDSPAAEKNYLNLAQADYKKAAGLSKDKGDVYYSEARLIYSIATSSEEPIDPEWTLEAAMKKIREAIRENDLPAYRQLEGDICFLQEDYENAYNAYMIVNQSDVATPQSYYMAAKAKEGMGNAQIFELLGLIDNAIQLYGPAPTAEAGPFILERIEKRLALAQYEEAIADYDLYHKIMGNNVNDNFYYLREQAKFRNGDLQGALADIQEAIHIDKENPIYYAEEASVYTRMEEYEKALASVKKALDMEPEFGSCYRIQGVCMLRLEKKAEACEAFAKAKEFGDPLADKLIRDNCQ